MDFLEDLHTVIYSLSISHHTVSQLLFTNEERDIRCKNQPCLSIPHSISASLCCSHTAKSPAFHKIHPHDQNGTNTAMFCVCERAVYNLSSVHLRVGTNQYAWTKPCWAIAPCCTPAGSSHSVYSSGISLSSPLCINQAAGRLRNMTNTLARISPAVKTQGGRGILN